MEVPAIGGGADQGEGLREWHFGKGDDGQKGRRDLCQVQACWLEGTKYRGIKSITMADGTQQDLYQSSFSRPRMETAQIMKSVLRLQSTTK